jgi:hypothetical protein
LLLAEKAKGLNKLARGHGSGEDIRNWKGEPVVLKRPSLASIQQVIVVFNTRTLHR